MSSFLPFYRVCEEIKHKSKVNWNGFFLIKMPLLIEWANYFTICPPPHYARGIEFENWGFTLKAHQMSSVHTAPEKFENATIIVSAILWVCSGKTNCVIRWMVAYPLDSDTHRSVELKNGLICTRHLSDSYQSDTTLRIAGISQELKSPYLAWYNKALHLFHPSPFVAF